MLIVIDCSKNFPNAHKAPTGHEILEILPKDSDTVDEVGAALTDLNGLFCGWIPRDQKEDIMDQLKAGKRLFARVEEAESFD